MRWCPVSLELRRETIPSGALECRGTLLWNEVSRSAVLIDPTDDPAPFLLLAERKGLRIRELLLTHAHVDHAAGADLVARRTGLAPRLHPDDHDLYARLPDWGARFGMAVAAPTVDPVPLEDGQSIDVEDGFRLKVVHTPGHTPGQVAFLVEEIGLVVVGDTLFRGSVGRTDLPGGDFRSLERSIRERLYSLPDPTVVVPGHGPDTTIGREKTTNPYVAA